ncbi:MAG: type II toxin-antitoxin system RelE/ParE family toxin [Betaproteobacteria bacterium]
MIVTYHPAASAEVAEAAAWYAQEAGEFLAREFLVEVEAALRLLLRHPSLGAPGKRKRRSLPLARFPYTVVYCIEREALRVLALAHQSRRPGYWRQRT